MSKHARIALRGAVAVVMAASPSTTFAQAPSPPRAALTINVGDGAIDGSHLEPYENAWLVSVHFKDGRIDDRGVWSDLLRFRDVDGRKVFVRTQGVTFVKGRSAVNVNTFDPATLAPISAEIHPVDGKVLKRSFAGTHIETHVTPPGGPEQVTKVDLPTPVFDFNGGMYGMLFAAQKLKVGATGTLPAISDATNDDVVVPSRVVGREKIRAGSRGTVNAWVVETGNPTYFKFWISDRAPYIIKLLAPGAEFDTVWEMIR